LNKYSNRIEHRMSEEFEDNDSISSFEDMEDDVDVGVSEGEEEEVIAPIIEGGAGVEDEDVFLEEDDEDLENFEEDENIINVSDNHKFEIVSNNKTYERIESKTRIGSPLMTITEMTKIIGIRSQQIASGMAPLVEVESDIRDTKFIAIKELLSKKMPLIIRRFYPNNMYVDWPVDELILPKTILF